MKLKTVVVSAVVTVSLIGGGIYGALRLYQDSSKKPVPVAPVANLSFDGGWGDENTTSATLISRNIQNVELNGDYRLQKVYVKEGDSVKRGDPLLEYDMTIKQLERELEDLNQKKLEMQQQSQEKELEKLMKNPGAAAIYAKLDKAAGVEEQGKTKSADVGDDALILDDGVSEEGVVEEPADAGGDVIDEQEAGGEIAGQDDLQGNGVQDPETTPLIEAREALPEEVPREPPSETPGTELSDIVEGEETPDESLFEDATEEDTIEDDGSEQEEESDLIQANIYEFLMLENLIRTYQYTRYMEDEKKDLSVFSEQDLSRALSVFQEKLSRVPEGKLVASFEDAFGEQRRENKYMLSAETLQALGDIEKKYADSEAPFSASEAIISLYKAYANVIYYNAVYRTAKLYEDMTKAGLDPAAADAQAAMTFRAQIRAAADAFYKYIVNWKTIQSVLEEHYGVTKEELETIGKEYAQEIAKAAGQQQTLTDPADGWLSRLISLLNNSDLVDPLPPETEDLEPLTEDIVPPDDGFDDMDMGDDETLTGDDLLDAVSEAWSDLQETKMDMRESEVKVRSLDRELSGKIVKAALDGVVKSAGEMDVPFTGEYFVVVTGKAGMYVQGTVGELERDSVKIGDTVTGIASDTGMSFSATISEISVYPGESNDFGYYYGEGNPNSSKYPFLAYIENADGLQEGYAEIQIKKSDSGGSGLYIENFFIREDMEGKSYVMIRGEDGLLKKSIVRTGKVRWGTSVEILSGLTRSDLIAFPYGKNVVEGAKTTEQENLDSMYG